MKNAKTKQVIKPTKKDWLKFYQKNIVAWGTKKGITINY